jgi:hypothetical protein
MNLGENGRAVRELRSLSTGMTEIERRHGSGSKRYVGPALRVGNTSEVEPAGVLRNETFGSRYSNVL